MITKEQALRYHSHGRPGKIEVVPTKPLSTQRDLALAYSPGVAEPCREIARDPDTAYRYTAKGNLVAVISNGSAVLGLGNIGAAASKPVMEGKAVLFKRFAGLDVFDIEVECSSPDEFVDSVARLEPTFGGINLEDIKSPECFYIEEQLRQRCSIPVMHDDQHGTAIISGAALLNACELVGKSIDRLSIVVLGSGAAALACASFMVSLGARLDHIVVCNEHGVVRGDALPSDAARTPLARFATTRDLRTFSDAIAGADMLLGLSVANIVIPAHLEAMNANPIVFTLANPDPEIDYPLALKTRPDAIMATGRSDYPNQVNNVLGFPYIFRGALDVGAREINEAMKRAAATALAELARQPVPMGVKRAYGLDEMSFGRQYLIPKPLDARLLTTVAPAVARAAVESGVARHPIEDWERYEDDLLERVGTHRKLIAHITEVARARPGRLLFADAENSFTLQAAAIVRHNRIAEPLLLGSREKIMALCAELKLDDLSDCRIIDPLRDSDLCGRYAELLFRRRGRRGITLENARRTMRDHHYFGAAMLAAGDVDALLAGRAREYPSVIRPALQLLGTGTDMGRIAGMHIVNTKDGALFFADTVVNVEPTATQLAEIIRMTARTVRSFDVEPVIAVISHSNFGSSRSAEAERCRMAVMLAKGQTQEQNNGIIDGIIDGEMRVAAAFDAATLQATYPFSPLAGKRVNTLVFPNLTAANAACNLLNIQGGAELVGPILMGLDKPVQLLPWGAEVRDIVNMATLAMTQAQKAPQHEPQQEPQQESHRGG